MKKYVIAGITRARKLRGKEPNEPADVPCTVQHNEDMSVVLMSGFFEECFSTCYYSAKRQTFQEINMDGGRSEHPIVESLSQQERVLNMQDKDHL